MPRNWEKSDEICVILAEYTKQGTYGWLENPDEDRKALAAGLAAKLGWELINIVHTRGDYDVNAFITGSN